MTTVEVFSPSSLQLVLKFFVIPIAAKLIRSEECFGAESDNEKIAIKIYKHAHKVAAPKK